MIVIVIVIVKTRLKILIFFENAINSLPKSTIFTWEYSYVICSAIFYIIEFSLKKKQEISFSTWKDIIRHVARLDSNNSKKLISVIQKNGFFELNPANAIQGARDYFNTAPFFDLERQGRNIKESIANICTVLQVDETTNTFLINTCLQEKSFLKIELFFKRLYCL